MPSKQFLQQVTSFIRSKEARSYVEVELQQHLAYAKKAWIQKGYCPEDAEQKAIAEMGSAMQLGKSLDKIHRPKWDIWLIGAVLLLIAASFLPLVTADLNTQFGDNMARYFIERKVVHILLATGLMALLITNDYRKLLRLSTAIYGVALLLLITLLTLPNSFIHGEAMLTIGPLRIQAWTVLPLLLVAFAGFFTERKWSGWQLIGLFLLPLYCFMSLPNLVVAALYSAVVVVLFSFSYFSRKIKKNVLLTLMGIGSALLAYSVYAFHYVLEDYQTARFTAFLQPELYAEGAGYIILQLKAVLAAAGWFGAGTMYSLPDAHTDYALVQLIQAYGYVAGITVIVLILAIALRLLWIARTMPHSFGKLLVLAAVTLYSFQSLYSILMVFGLLPIVSMPLPFISYGLTPLLLNALLIGLVLSVYRRKAYVRRVNPCK